MAETKFAELARPIQRAIDNMKRDLMAFAGKFQIVQESRSELAPKFMKLYAQVSGDYEVTFVEFVRYFDATVPTSAAGENGYRLHKTYMAADYLRRLTRQRPRGRQGVRDSATDALARTIATVAQIVRDHDAMWRAIQKEFSFSERVMTGLRRRVDSTKPLFTLGNARPVAVGNVIHMEPQTKAEATAPAVASARKRAA